MGDPVLLGHLQYSQGLFMFGKTPHFLDHFSNCFKSNVSWILGARTAAYTMYRTRSLTSGHFYPDRVSSADRNSGIIN